MKKEWSWRMRYTAVLFIAGFFAFFLLVAITARPSIQHVHTAIGTNIVQPDVTPPARPDPPIVTDADDPIDYSKFFKKK